MRGDPGRPVIAEPAGDGSADGLRLSPGRSGYEGGHDGPAASTPPAGTGAPPPGHAALRKGPVIVDVIVRLAPHPASVAAARRVVTEALASVEVDPAAVEDIRLAVSEACANVVLHGPAEATYEVALHLRDDHCEVLIRDGGAELDAEELPDSLPPVSSPSGRGLALMRAVMDEVEVTNDPDRGTVVRLVKGL